MKKFLILLMLSVSFTMYAQTTLQVTTRKGITTVTSGVDSLSVFGITEPYEITQTSFKALACVVLTDNVMDDAIWAGVCYTSDNTEPSLENGSLVKQFSNGSRVHTVLLDNLTSATTYFYRIFVQFADGNIAYGKVYRAKTHMNGGDVPSDNPYSKFINGHEFIDLGLPSGLYWATCNVGAESEIDCGNFYAWGETSTKSSYDADNSKWYGTYLSSSYNLTATEDAATVEWGSAARMPVPDDIYELYNNCTWSWTDNYKKSSVRGYVVTGRNKQSIFLPVTGYMIGSERSNENSGYYWTSSASSPANGQESGAWSFYFTENGILINDYSDFRYRGTTIRAVSDKDAQVDPTPDPTPSQSKEYNGHKFVDLGLPSGLYWATCNVGAESETDYGDYYAWGEINTKNEYTSSNYNGYTERNGEGLTEDEDVARQKWGENIRMPKVDELTELKENCTWTWQNNYKQSGTNGYLVTGFNGNSIFLPASGCYSSYSYLLGSICSYWSSSCDDNSSCAIDIDAYSGGNISIDHFSDRANGQPIRPVVEKQVIEHPTTSKFVNGYEFVDLGLPSGLYWAKNNLGAESEAEDGDYYAWGDSEPNGSGCSSASDFKDAATVKWGEGVRMPSHEEQKELVENCTFTWVEDYKGTGKTGSVCTGPNGQSIFFPAAGSINGSMVEYGSIGSYWSSSNNNSWSDPWDMDIRQSGAETEYYSNFYYLRQSIRPVAK